MKATLKYWKSCEKNFNDYYLRRNAFQNFPSKKIRERMNAVNHAFEISIPAELVTIYKHNSASEINLRFSPDKDGFVKMLMHPFALEEMEFLKEFRKKKVSVSGTHSFRTFFLNDFIAKLSLPQTSKTGDFHKYLLAEQIERSVSISQALEREVIEQKANSSHFGYLQESFGMHMKSKKYPWGMLIRSIPQEVIEGKKSLISLIAYVHRPEGKASLMERHALLSDNLENFVLQNLVIPIIESFLYLYREHCLICECHQQNLLLELDSTKMLTGKVIYRDLEGCRVDMERRKALGLNQENFGNVSNFNRIHETKKVVGFKKRLHPNLRKSLAWNGAIEFAYRKFVEHSALHLLERGIKQSPLLKGNSKINMVTMGEAYLNYALLKRHPELKS